MKFPLLFISLFIVCALNAQRRIIPFKNTYINYPDTIASNYEFDETWNKIILLLQQNGFGAKLIDKSTGIITVKLDKGRLTVEDKNAKINTSAWVVVQRIYVVARNEYYSLKESPIVWNLRILPDKSTKVIIDSLNLLATTKVFTYNIIEGVDNSKEYHTLYKSTGKLEAIIKNALQ